MTNSSYQPIRKKKAIRTDRTQVLRHIVQAAAFLFFPGLFLTVFHALGDVISAAFAGTFSLGALASQLVILTVTLFVTAVWGRFFCGYLCAFGSAQEFFFFLSRKMFRIRALPSGIDRILKYVKYAVLAFIVGGVWTLQLPIDTSLSPWGVFGMLISGNPSVMLSAVPTVGFLLLIAVVIASFFAERFFCRMLCPLGAVFTLISGKRLYRINRSEIRCSGCRRCSRTCPMGISVHEGTQVASGECVDCMRCAGICPPAALRAKPEPAVAGTASALAICGLIRVGELVPAKTMSVNPAIVSDEIETIPDPIAFAEKENAVSGMVTDGVYTGEGSGFRGKVRVQVTVENGSISDITVLSYKDDREFFGRASSGVIPAILSAQDPEVDAVSGATWSSKGIMEAVADALAVPVAAAKPEVPDAEEEPTDWLDAFMSEPETGADAELPAEETPEAEPEPSFFRSIDEDYSETPAPEEPSEPENEGIRADEGTEAVSNGWNQAWNDVVEDPVTNWRDAADNTDSVAEPADEWSWPENDSIAEDPVPEWNQTWNEHDEEPVSEWNWSGNGDTAEAWAAPETNGSFADGVYTGSGTGLRGTVQVSVTVEGGRIADITILSYADDAPYFSKAQNTVIANILAAQSVNVSTVSGATYSSNGILEATANALGLDFTNPNSSGTGRGGRGRH